MKYSFPLNEPGVIRPHMSVWINSRGLVTKNLDFPNCLLVYFPITHPSQNLFSKSRFDSYCTDCFFTKSLRPLYPSCLNLMCHNQASFSLLILRHFCSILCKFSLKHYVFSHFNSSDSSSSAIFQMWNSLLHEGFELLFN
jgi:hypothetical protein